MTPAEPPSPLVLAAQELEDELRRFENAVAEAVRLRLHSEKQIGKAARTLKTANEHLEGLGGKVNALLAAINSARARADETTARMATRAGELQARLARLQSLKERAGDIAGSVRDTTAFAQQTKDSNQILERLRAVEERVAQAFEEARAEEFDDVAGDMAALREMLAALRKKLESSTK